MVKYLIYNEDEELMRVVHRREEAEALCAPREGWHYKAKQYKRKQFDLSQCEDAPF